MKKFPGPKKLVDVFGEKMLTVTGRWADEWKYEASEFGKFFTPLAASVGATVTVPKRRLLTLRLTFADATVAMTMTARGKYTITKAERTR